MRRIPPLGWPLLAAGIALVGLGLYAADALLLLQSALLHFIEHMQMMWDDMGWLPRRRPYSKHHRPNWRAGAGHQ